MLGWRALLTDFEERYYTDLALWLFELIAIVTGILFVKNQKIGKVFLFYLIFDFTILNIATSLRYFQGVPVNVSNNFVTLTNPLIFLIELFAYYYFFLNTLKSSGMIKALKVLFPLYLIIIGLFLTGNLQFLSGQYGYVSYTVSALGFLFLLPPCINYFYMLLNTKSEISLFQRPSFWIVSGMFFYCIVSIPYYLLVSYLFITDYEYKQILSALLFNVPFLINFIFLTRAFLCKKTLSI
jgi:hypothetical protein